jgi:hypothetical protein
MPQVSLASHTETQGKPCLLCFFKWREEPAAFTGRKEEVPHHRKSEGNTPFGSFSYLSIT